MSQGTFATPAVVETPANPTRRPFAFGRATTPTPASRLQPTPISAFAASLSTSSSVGSQRPPVPSASGVVAPPPPFRRATPPPPSGLSSAPPSTMDANHDDRQHRPLQGRVASTASSCLASTEPPPQQPEPPVVHPPSSSSDHEVNASAFPSWAAPPSSTAPALPPPVSAPSLPPASWCPASLLPFSATDPVLSSGRGSDPKLVEANMQFVKRAFQPLRPSFDYDDKLLALFGC